MKQALLGRLEVLVVGADVVLDDRDRDAAVGRRQQGRGQVAPRLVVTPLERAHDDASPGRRDPLEDSGVGGRATGQQLERRAGTELGRRSGDREQRHRGAKSSTCPGRAANPESLDYSRLTSRAHSRYRA